MLYLKIQVIPIMLLLTPNKNTWIFLSKKQKNINFFFKMNKKSRYEKKSQFLGVGEEPFLNLVTYL